MIGVLIYTVIHLLYAVSELWTTEMNCNYIHALYLRQISWVLSRREAEKYYSLATEDFKNNLKHFLWKRLV